MISDEDLEVLTVSMDVVLARCGTDRTPGPLALLPAIFDAPPELAAGAAQAVLELVAEVRAFRRAAKLVGAR